MRFCTLLLSLAVACLVGIDAAAQNTTKHPLRDRFEKMDTNHDGILTLPEFVAGHPKMGAKGHPALSATGDPRRQHCQGAPRRA